jgi:hypothetical protein
MGDVQQEQVKKADDGAQKPDGDKNAWAQFAHRTGDTQPLGTDAPGAPQRPGAAASDAPLTQWSTNMQTAGNALMLLSLAERAIRQNEPLKDEAGHPIKDEAGRPIDVHKATQDLKDFAETNLWKAFQSGQGDSNVTASNIFSAFAQQEHYMERMKVIADQPQFKAALQAAGITGENVTPDDVKNAILKLGVLKEPGSDLAKDPKARALTEYLTASEAASLYNRKASQETEIKKAPMLAGLALAEYSLEHGNGVLVQRDANGKPVMGTDGKPKAVTAAQILDAVVKADRDMSANPTSQELAKSADVQMALLVKKFVPNDNENPLITLQKITDPKDLASFQRAVQQAQAPAFAPENIQKLRDGVKQDLDAGKITEQEARARDAGLDIMSHLPAAMEEKLGTAMLHQQNPDYAGALQHLKNAAKDTVVMPKEGPTAEQIVSSVQIPDQFRKDHPNLVSLANSQDFQNLYKETDAQFKHAIATLYPKDDNGQPKPVSPDDLLNGRHMMEDAYDKSKKIAGMIGDKQKEEIDSQYTSLSQKKNPTDAEKAQLQAIAPFYEVLHMHSLLGLQLGDLYSRSGDPHLGKHKLEEVEQDKTYVANSAEVQSTLMKLKAGAQAGIENQADWFSKYGKWIGFGVAAAGALIATAATFGGAAPVAMASIVALGEGLGLGATASTAIAAGTGWGLSMAAGTAVGATLESKSLLGLGHFGTTPGVAETWGEGVKDSFGPAFQGASLGGMLPLMAAPAALSEAASVAPMMGELKASYIAYQEGAKLAEAAALQTGSETLVAKAASSVVPEIDDSYLAWNTGAEVLAAQPAAAALTEAAARTATKSMLGRGLSWMGQQTLRVPGVEQGVGGYNWIRAGLASVKAPQQALVDSMAARLGGGAWANMAVRSTQYGAIGLGASLPTLWKDGPGAYLQEASLYPLLGVFGTSLAAPGAGMLPRIGSFVAKAGVIGAGDLGRQAVLEKVDPLTQNGDYLGHVGLRMYSDFLDKNTMTLAVPGLTKPFSNYLPPMAMPMFLPMIVNSAENNMRETARLKELEEEIAARKRAAQQAAQPQA